MRYKATDTYLESSIVPSQDERISQAHELGARADNHIKTHEAVCAERYKQIQVAQDSTIKQLQDIKSHFDERLKIRDRLQVITIAAVLLGPGAAADLIRKLVGL